MKVLGLLIYMIGSAHYSFSHHFTFGSFCSIPDSYQSSIMLSLRSLTKDLISEISVAGVRNNMQLLLAHSTTDRKRNYVETVFIPSFPGNFYLWSVFLTTCLSG